MNNKRLEQLKKMLEEDPEDAFLLYAMATEYVSLGDDEEARKWFGKVLNLHPDYLATYYHYGLLLHRAGEADEAADLFRKGIALAEQAGDRKATNELREALEDVEDY